MRGTRLARRGGVVIRRCSWHRHYHGHHALYGIAAWGGWNVRFTEGICRSCARRLRRELRVPAPGWPGAASLKGGAPPMPVPPLAIGLIALSAVVFVARPLDSPPRMTTPDAPSLGGEPAAVDRRARPPGAGSVPGTGHEPGVGQASNSRHARGAGRRVAPQGSVSSSWSGPARRSAAAPRPARAPVAPPESAGIQAP